VLEIQNGLSTRTAYIAERGRTLEEVFAELAAEDELAEQKGITITAEVEPTPEAPPATDEEEDAPAGDRTLHAIGDGLR